MSVGSDGAPSSILDFDLTPVIDLTPAFPATLHSDFASNMKLIV